MIRYDIWTILLFNVYDDIFTHTTVNLAFNPTVNLIESQKITLNTCLASMSYSIPSKLVDFLSDKLRGNQITQMCRGISKTVGLVISLIKLGKGYQVRIILLKTNQLETIIKRANMRRC